MHAVFNKIEIASILGNSLDSQSIAHKNILLTLTYKPAQHTNTCMGEHTNRPRSPGIHQGQKRLKQNNWRVT